MVEMRKMVHAQTVLFQEDVVALKMKTGDNVEVSLAKAVAQYLACGDAPKEKPS